MGDDDLDSAEVLAYAEQHDCTPEHASNVLTWARDHGISPEQTEAGLAKLESVMASIRARHGKAAGPPANRAERRAAARRRR